MANGKKAAPEKIVKDKMGPIIRQAQNEAYQVKKKIKSVFGRARLLNTELTKTEFRRMVKQGRAIARDRDPYFGRPVTQSRAIVYATW